MFIHKAQNRAHHCLKIIFTKHQSKKKVKLRQGNIRRRLVFQSKRTFGGKQTFVNGQTIRNDLAFKNVLVDGLSISKLLHLFLDHMNGAISFVHDGVSTTRS